MDQAGILSTVHHSHATFTDLLQNLVMANGRADHTTPPSCRQICPRCYAVRLLKTMNIGSAKGTSLLYAYHR